MDNEPKKVSQTEEQLAILSKSTEALLSISKLLSERLKNVLRPVSEKGGESVMKAPEVLSPVAEAVRGQSMMVGGSLYILEDILRRLEV